MIIALFRLFLGRPPVFLAALLLIAIGCSPPTESPPVAEVGRLRPFMRLAAQAREQQAREQQAGKKKTPPPVKGLETPPAATTPAKEPAAPPSRAPLFEGWKKPLFVLALTGQQMGYIEPCGCTGLANQKGGLARRYTFLRQLREERGWEVVPLDVGNQVRRYGKQSEIKFQKSAEGLRAMQYRAITFGPEDLRLGVGEVFTGTNPDDQTPKIFTSANVALFGREHTPAFLIVTAGGKKIGVAGVLGNEFEKRLQGEDIVHQPAQAALQAATKAIVDAKCDVRVLLAHATAEETQEIAKKFPQYQLVVTAGGLGEPTLELEPIEGTKSLLAQVGTKGMYLGVVGFFDDPKKPIRYQRVPLDSGVADSPEMLTLLKTYQDELKALGLEELGLKPRTHSSGNKFIGSEKCGVCHAKALEVWLKTPHAKATESLQKPPGRADIPRHFDPECLSCHVTGWEPQKFFPFASGYLSLEKTPALQHNGCENCHGPGSAHAAAEADGANLNQDQVAKLRNGMKLPLAGGVAEKRCMECHDLDNSPEFHAKGAFEKYWKKVEHKGKD